MFDVISISIAITIFFIQQFQQAADYKREINKHIKRAIKKTSKSFLEKKKGEYSGDFNSSFLYNKKNIEGIYRSIFDDSVSEDNIKFETDGFGINKLTVKKEIIDYIKILNDNITKDIYLNNYKINVKTSRKVEQIYTKMDALQNNLNFVPEIYDMLEDVKDELEKSKITEIILKNSPEYRKNKFPFSGKADYDILEFSEEHKYSSYVYEIYNLIDQYIIQAQTDILKKLKCKIGILEKKELRSPALIDEVKKLRIIAEVLCIMDKDRDLEKIKEAKILLMQAIKISNSSFDMGDLAFFKYTYLDIRILIIYSVLERVLKENKIAIQILVFCFELIDSTTDSTYFEKLLIIKIIANISYCYYSIDNPKETLKYADLGIEYARSNKLMYGISLLFFRKGIAELEMGILEYKKSIKKALDILDIQGDVQLKELYESVLEKKYKLVF